MHIDTKYIYALICVGIYLCIQTYIMYKLNFVLSVSYVSTAFKFQICFYSQATGGFLEGSRVLSLMF